MKNLINYYYNLYVDNIKKLDDNFEFEIENKKYEFLSFNGDLKELYNTYLIIKKNNKYCHEIILNKDGSIATYYNGKFYVLIKNNLCIDKYVDIYEIENYCIPIFGRYSIGWKKLWKDKVDYYEYQMNQIGFKYPKIKQSFDYYIGLTECAIGLLNYVNTNDISYNICHKRIIYKEKLCKFYNPVEIVIDSRCRDIAEYIKVNYINGNLTMKDIYIIIERSNFNNQEIILFLSRIIYPSYYFDLYDKIIQGKMNESKINLYIKSNENYEMFIKKIYIFLKNIYYLPDIEWLDRIYNE